LQPPSQVQPALQPQLAALLLTDEGHPEQVHEPGAHLQPPSQVQPALQPQLESFSFLTDEGQLEQVQVPGAHLQPPSQLDSPVSHLHLIVSG
jgi:hypothetical protein